MRGTFAAVATALTVASCAGSITGTGSHERPAAPGTTNRPTVATYVPSTPPRSEPSATRPATLPTRLLGQEWTRLPTTRRVVALTFDAGSDAAGVPSILATLAAERVAATFFLTGNWAQNFPGMARTIAASFRVGNHSMTHPHFTSLTAVRMRAEIERASAAIRAVCGVATEPLFRFPYGDRDARTIRIVNEAGYLPIGWTVDTLGWEGTRHGGSADAIVARVVASARPGEIVLMHVGANPDDRSTLDADALPRVIAALRDRGYTFVGLDALLT